jgi:hypothetical protein
MLVRSGAPVKWISRFLSQPVIKDYMSFQEANESIVNKVAGSELTKKEIVKKTLSKYKSVYMLYEQKEKYDSEYETMFEEFVFNNELDKLPAYKYKETNDDKTRWSQISNMIQSGLFSEEKLSEYISYGISKSENETSSLDHIKDYYDEVQATILDMFLEYQRQSKQFQELIRATSADTKGIGQNRASIEYSNNITKKVLLSGIYGNADKLIDNTIVKMFQKTKERTLQIYEPLYLIEKEPLLKSAVRSLYNLYNPFRKNEKERLKLNNVIENDLMMALMSINYDNKEVTTKSVYEELVVPTAEKSKYRNNNGKPISFAQLINLIKTASNEDIKNNESLRKYQSLKENKFIQKLTGVISNEKLTYDEFKSKTSVRIGKPSINYIKYVNTQGIQEDQNADTEAIEQIKEKFPEFYNDLIKFAVYQNGFNVTPNSFVDKIPAVDIINMKRSAVEDFLALSKGQQEYVMDQFISQFKSRNLQFNPGIKKVTRKDRFNRINRSEIKLENKETISVDNGIDEVTTFKTRYSSFNGLVAVKKDIKSDLYRRYIVRGALDTLGAYVNYDINDTNSYVPIVGEESYFTGYDISLLENEKQASKYEFKKLELLEREKAAKEERRLKVKYTRPSTQTELPLQELFTVKGITNPDKEKAPAKAAVSTKYIGFGEGSTAKYADQIQKQVDDNGLDELVNIDEYTKDDVIFVSVNGKDSSTNDYKTGFVASMRKTKKLLKKAIDAGATIVKDTEDFIYKNNDQNLSEEEFMSNPQLYNIGEKLISDYLDKNGYEYSKANVTIVKNNKSITSEIGVWKPKSLSSMTNESINNMVNDKATDITESWMDEEPNNKCNS